MNYDGLAQRRDAQCWWDTSLLKSNSLLLSLAIEMERHIRITAKLDCQKQIQDCQKPPLL